MTQKSKLSKSTSSLFISKHIAMTTADEKLCLQWNDFKENVTSAFGDLRQDKEFADVTLVCDDGQQVEAHKLVVVASSPFFKNILTKNKHPHPLIYMRGVRSENLLAMVDFFYLGEAKVRQENLDTFLLLAEDLQLKGLRGNQAEKEAEIFQEPPTQSPQSKLHNLRPTSKNNSLKKSLLLQNGQNQTESEKTLALVDHKTNATDLQGLDQQVKCLMTFSENANPYVPSQKARICKVCGKEGSIRNIMNHIEANHIFGISIPFDLCEKLCTSRNSLSVHKSQQHRNKDIK